MSVTLIDPIGDAPMPCTTRSAISAGKPRQQRAAARSNDNDLRDMALSA